MSCAMLYVTAAPRSLRLCRTLHTTEVHSGTFVLCALRRVLYVGAPRVPCITELWFAVYPPVIARPGGCIFGLGSAARGALRLIRSPCEAFKMPR
jgi:hypothetical protein